MADRIQLRRDTKANWESYNPILLEGEPGHVLDYPNLYKMGDGIHAWNELPYRGYDGTILQDVQDGEQNAVPSSDAVYRALVNLGLTNRQTINNYVAEIYVKDSSTPISQIDFAIAHYVSTGTYAGKYLNLLRIRCSQNTIVRQFIDPTYYDTEVGAITAWNSATQSKILRYNNEDDYVIALTDRKVAPVKQVSSTEIYKDCNDLEALPIIRNYYQQQTLEQIPSNIEDAKESSGESLTNSIIINRYIKEIIHNNKGGDNTKTIKVFLAVGYHSSSNYLNVIRIDEYNSNNERIYVTEYFKDSFTTLAEALAGIRTGIVENQYGKLLLADGVEFTEAVDVTEIPLHSLTYDYAPNLREKRDYTNLVVEGNIGEQLTKNVFFNRYVKEVVVDVNANTKYIKLLLRLGYLYNNIYYNYLRVQQYDENDTRIAVDDIFNATYSTFEEAVAAIPKNTIINSQLLLADIDVTEQIDIEEIVIHPLTYDYAPSLLSLKNQQSIKENNIGEVRSESVNVTTDNTSVYRLSLIAGRKYNVDVLFASALPNAATIYVRHRQSGSTVNVKSYSVAQGETRANFDFIAPITYESYYLVFAEGSGVRVNYTVKVYDYINLQATTKSLKVLLVGSSYGVNTISMFPVLAYQAGIDITCGSLYYGSASIGLVNIRPLAHHPSKFALNQDYGWYKKFINGAWESGTGTEGYRTYQHALQDEKWDIIIMQRGAEELKLNSEMNLAWSDMQTSCLQQMIEYTRSHCDYEPTILFADGLANPVGHAEAYGAQTRETQVTQSEKIAASAQTMKSKFGIDIIPVGIALQNARNTLLSKFGYHGGDIVNPGDMACDGQHLDAGIGYYVTGAALFEYILKPRFGISIMNLDYLPSISDVENCWVRSSSIPRTEMFNGITTNNINIAKYAVLDAIADPTHVSQTIGQRYSAMFSVTQNLTHCKSCFQNTRCETTFFALITPDDGYTLGTPVITMGGTDITSSVYSTLYHPDYPSILYGKVSIPNVTGNIVITLSAS